MSLIDLLPDHLARQRWFAGRQAKRVTVVSETELRPGLRWLLLDADGARYQLVLTARPAAELPEFLHGQDAAVVGDVDGEVVFDATLDPERAMDLLDVVVPGEQARHVRPVGAEQSNTSLVFEDRLILKLFRRIHSGPNPEVEVTTALAAVGFDHVAEPVGAWRQDDADLAVCQRFLPGGFEGWAMALTSLRDFYASGCEDPGACGGDFAGEAGRIGEVTARLHLAMAHAFGMVAAQPSALVAGLEAELAKLEPGDIEEVASKSFAERLRGVVDAGAAIRVHGDFHLGQVMRTDQGWFVLDFEGEPARPVAERRVPASPLKDVAGMLRSLHYAAEVALSERGGDEQVGLETLAQAWEDHNRQAFLEGYGGVEGITGLLPPSAGDRAALLAAFELEKAAYEVRYERAHRPDWVPIPLGAIRRLLG